MRAGGRGWHHVRAVAHGGEDGGGEGMGEQSGRSGRTLELGGNGGCGRIVGVLEDQDYYHQDQDQDQG